MDWKLTKSIYITVFLLLNISLGFILYRHYVEDVDIVQSTESTLEEANIVIEEVIMPPEDGLLSATASMYDFTAQDTTTETDFEISDDGYTLHYDVTDEDIPMDLEMLTNFKNEFIFNGSSYRHSDVVSDLTHQVYLQQYNDLPIFDASYARVTLVGESRMLEYYDQTLLYQFEEVETLINETIISPQGIVESMYTRGFITEDSTVELIHIGYDSVFVDENSILLRPAYEVIVIDADDNERQFVVDALSLTGSIRERE